MIAYIAAPYAAPSLHERSLNVARACLLARALLLRRGWSCIVPHPAIHAGAYGDDTSPEQREAGMRSTLEQVEMVARVGGALVAIARDPTDDIPTGVHFLSPGTSAEVMAYQEACDRRAETRTWREWRAVLDIDGLGIAREWDVLGCQDWGPWRSRWRDALDQIDRDLAGGAP